VTDHYETLQISTNAEPETIHRVYRLLAQRFHPDNLESGNPERFRAVLDAYQVLGDAERRAQYDVAYNKQRNDRVRLVGADLKAETDHEVERLTRLTVLELLYARRRLEPREPGLFDGDMEKLIGRPREHLEFTFWYLIQKGMVSRADHSRLQITAQGVDYIEEHYYKSTSHHAPARKALEANGASV
jgi:curved DNA-binding protein CbpA